MCFGGDKGPEPRGVPYAKENSHLAVISEVTPKDKPTSTPVAPAQMAPLRADPMGTGGPVAGGLNIKE
jgi:hypothetical protein